MNIVKKLKLMGVLMIPGGAIILATGLLVGLKQDAPPQAVRIAISCIGGMNSVLGTLIVLGCRKFENNNS